MRIEKICNAFVPEASARDIDTGIFGMVINDEIKRFKKKYGGLWVGGKLIVEGGKLFFRQNLMNKAFHTTENDLEVSLDKIENICLEYGAATGGTLSENPPCVPLPT